MKLPAAMNFRHLPPLAAALVAAVALAAAPSVEVQFTDTAKFSDLRLTTFANDKERQGLAEALRRHLVEQAPRHLRDDAKLAILITGVDMAGEFRPIASSARGDIRLVVQMFPPRVDLQFKLTRADGTVEREGKRELRDAGFLIGTQSGGADVRQYEKDLLDRWLGREFPAKR